MFNRNKEPWVVRLINKIAHTFFFMSVISFFFFFVSSEQGISNSLAYGFLTVVTIASLIAVLLLTISLLFSIIKRENILKKIWYIVRCLVNIIISIIILISGNSIYILSLGTME